MPAIGPIKRRDLIAYLRILGFEPPVSGGEHQYMKGTRNSQLTARPSTINADGLTIATVTVTLKDETNTPVSGKPVTLTQGAGHSTITPPSGTSDSYGEVTFRVSNSTPETVTYTAVDTADSITVTQQGIVSFTPVQGAPPAVTLSAPSNGATVPSGAPTLSWGASEGATSYNVYLGTSYPPGLAATVGTTSYTGANLTSGATYYWYVVATNGSGSSSSSPTWSFTISGPSVQWTPVGWNIYFSGANVGIGSATPGYKLDVQGGQINASGGYCINGANCITAWPTAGSGGVTSITAGSGLAGGTITTSGTLSLNVGNVNTWSGAQTFSAATMFPGGIWTSGG